MKTTILALVALVAQVALSVPHGGHKRAHGKREPARNADRFKPNNNDWFTATTTFTTITTVTDPAAIVWVDQNNNVIYTEFKSKPTNPQAPPDTQPQETSVSPPNPPPAPSPEAAPAPLVPADPSPAPPPPASSAPAPSANLDTQPKGDGSQVGNAQSSSSGGGYGICYDLMATPGSCRSLDEMNKELGFIKSQGFGMIRSYDIGCNVGDFVAAAGNNGMKAIIGINLIDNVAGNLGTLIQKVGGNWGPVHTVNIGNEVVNRGGDPNAVAAAVDAGRSQLRAAGYNGNVVTIDTFNQHLAYPALCGASDYCAANAHAFFDPQTSAPQAGQWVKDKYNSLAAKANGKKVVITESGWAKSGATEGASVPGVAEQQAAVASLKAAFAGNPDELYIFQAYDATYKADAGARGVERSFGIF